jgi:hypothetical protein
MARSESTILVSLSMAHCVLALLVGLPISAQAQSPQKAEDRKKVDSHARASAPDQDPDPYHDIAKKLQKIASDNPVSIPPDDPEIRKLLIARRDSAMRKLKFFLAEYEMGRIPPEKLADVIFFGLDAQIALSNQPRYHVPSLELRLELARKLESRAEAELQIGRITEGDKEDAVLRRLGAEIDLLRAKRGLSKK